MAKTPEKNGSLETISVKATKWIGTTASLIVHTIIFIISLLLPHLGIISVDEVLLVLTTVVSLEAIYLAIFIQMTVNRNNESLVEVEKDIDEISEDIDDIQEDVDELSEDIDEIQEDVDESEKNDSRAVETLATIETRLREIMREIENLKSEK